MALPPNAISFEKLRGDDYLLSLLDESARAGLLGDADIARIADDCRVCVAALIKRRGRGKSTSLPVEYAGQILGSAAYAAGLFLKSLPSPEYAAGYLRRRGFTAALRNGRIGVERTIQSACINYHRALSSRVPTDNETYVMTLCGGLRGFFRLYDPVYAAQERIITCDYPLILPPERLCGVEYIDEYIRRLYFENLICSAADPAAHAALILRLEPNGKHGVVNLALPVLIWGTLCRICGSDTRVFEPDAAILRTEAERLAAMSPDALRGIFCDTVDEVYSGIPADGGEKAAYRDYLRRAAGVAAGEFRTAVLRGSLTRGIVKR